MRQILSGWSIAHPQGEDGKAGARAACDTRQPENQAHQANVRFTFVAGAARWSSPSRYLRARRSASSRLWVDQKDTSPPPRDAWRPRPRHGTDYARKRRMRRLRFSAVLRQRTGVPLRAAKGRERTPGGHIIVLL